MSYLNQLFHFCPHCGSQAFSEKAPQNLVCNECDFHLHLNPAVAVGGIVLDLEGRILLIRRARNPGIGKWGTPGGFIDPNETAEDALRREVREELNLEVGALHYLGSFPNEYLYRGVTYVVLDLFFVCRAASSRITADTDEVRSYSFLKPEEIEPDEVAFPSVRKALETYRVLEADEKQGNRAKSD